MRETRKIASTATRTEFDSAVRQAVTSLRAGQVVALPTETVYGLAANGLSDEAVAQIFAIKGRPATNPIILHVGSLEMARRLVAEWPPVAERLAKAFWAGPLTLVLKKASHIPDRVTAGGPTVALRWPSHPLMQEVIRQCGFPIAAPSANPSNRLSPTRAEHVWQGLDGSLPLIIDGGQCQVGIESTVLDLTVSPPKVLRPGIIHWRQIAAVLEKGPASEGDGSEKPDQAEVTERAENSGAEARSPLRSPGLLEKHYAPKARLQIWEWGDDAGLLQQIEAAGYFPDEVTVISHSRIPMEAPLGGVSVMPSDPEAFARALYAELHHCDQEAIKLIVVEALPKQPEWEGIEDRLKRASGS